MFRVMPMRNEALKSEKGVPPTASQEGYRYWVNRAILKKIISDQVNDIRTCARWNLCPVDLMSGGL